MSDTRHLLINMILYGLLPLWGIAGFIDWLCHRRTQVERTSGVSEVEVHGRVLRCTVYGSFQPFLEALRGHEVINLRSISSGE